MTGLVDGLQVRALCHLLLTEVTEVVVVSVGAFADLLAAVVAEVILVLVGVVGQLLFSHGFMVYAAILIAVAMQLFLSRSHRGLHLRAVGENPATADAAGINVSIYKYLSTCIGCGIAGLGGMYYVMDYTKGTWAHDGTIETLGWLAVALVIFTTWKPKNAIWGSYLFGMLYWMYLYIPGLSRNTQPLFKMLPYVVTIAVLIVISIHKKRENQPPASLGLPYFREER
jgi:simple sugar transport system permease protein